ncbi:MAG: hypothetical protein OHK0029_12570 [Armatimonadaceae bacterium]
MFLRGKFILVMVLRGIPDTEVLDQQTGLQLDAEEAPRTIIGVQTPVATG